MQHYLQRLSSKNMFLLLLALCILLVTWLSFTYREAIGHALTLATTHEPETYTELYFNNVSKLPLNIAPNRPAQISFHITNHEASTERYVFQSTMNTAGRTTLLRTDSVQLLNGQGANEAVAFKIPTNQTTAIITVSLVGRSNRIDFRTTT